MGIAVFLLPEFSARRSDPIACRLQLAACGLQKKINLR